MNLNAIDLHFEKFAVDSRPSFVAVLPLEKMNVVNLRFDIPTSMELIRSIPTIRHDWRFKSPYRKFCYFYGWGRMLGTYLQVPIFEDDQRLCWWSYFGYFYYLTHTLLATYTIYYYSMRSEYSKAFPCTILLIGPLIAVKIKINFQFNSIEFSNEKLLSFSFSVQTFPLLLIATTRPRIFLHRAG